MTVHDGRHSEHKCSKKNQCATGVDAGPQHKQTTLWNLQGGVPHTTGRTW